MAAIREVKIWKKGDDVRVYINTVKNLSACIYVTGNKWNKKGAIVSDLTQEELDAARALAFRDGCWHATRPQRSVARQTHGDPRRCSESNPCGCCFDCVAE